MSIDTYDNLRTEVVRSLQSLLRSEFTDVIIQMIRDSWQQTEYYENPGPPVPSYKREIKRGIPFVIDIFTNVYKGFSSEEIKRMIHILITTSTPATQHLVEGDTLKYGLIGEANYLRHLQRLNEEDDPGATQILDNATIEAARAAHLKEMLETASQQVAEES